MDKEKIEVLILRVGKKYLNAPIRLRLIIGGVLAGDIELKNKKK